MVHNLDEIGHGAMFTGLVIGICLYGIMIVQTLMYFDAFKKDPTWRKRLVGFLFILDTASSVFGVTFAYESLISHFGDVPYFQHTYLFITCDAILMTVIATSVQLFFAWRIQVLTSSKWFTSVIVFCALASFCGGIATAVTTTRICADGFFLFQNPSDFHKFEHAAVAWFVFDSLTNVILTFTLVWHLKSHKTGFKSTDDLIEKVIKITVPTGMITTIFTAGFVISFFVDSHKTELFFYFSISKLYTNSMLSSLNSRGQWSYGRNESKQQGSSRSDSALQTVEGYTGETEGHQITISPTSNKHAEDWGSGGKARRSCTCKSETQKGEAPYLE